MSHRAKRPELRSRLWRFRRIALVTVGIALVWAAHAGPLRAQGIQAAVDRNEATTEDQIHLVVTVEGSRTARPQLPPLPEFQVVPRGQSSQFQLVNGRMSTSISYNYILLPRSTGTFTIGAAAVEIDGERYESRPFQVRIVDPASQPRQSRQLFVAARVSNSSPYLGEQVIYTWQFFRRVQVTNAGLEPMEFKGFLTEDLGEVRESTATVGGVQYLVSEIRKALFPQEVGRLVVPATQLTCQVVMERPRRSRSLFDDFFTRSATQTKVLTTRPIEVNVRPLPPTPARFSRLVGDFTLGAEISKTELKVGESATLTLTVSGTGNAQLIAEPSLPELASFKVYDDKPSGKLDRSGKALRGSKSFRKALVPLAPGNLTIPPIELTYFDPRKQIYRTASTRAMELNVLPGDREELRLTESLAPTTGKVAVQILADDILPIYKGLDALSSEPLWGRSPSFSLVSFLAPPAFFLGLLLVRRRQERFDLDAGLRRRRGAHRRALDEARGIVQDKDSAAAARRASRCLRQYVGDKLDAEGSALTPEEVHALLRRHQVDEGLARTTHELLEQLEAAQYGAGLVERNPAALLSRVRSTLRDLERQIRA